MVGCFLRHSPMLFATNILILFLVPLVIRAMKPGTIEYPRVGRPEIEVSRHLIHAEKLSHSDQKRAQK